MMKAYKITSFFISLFIHILFFFFCLIPLKKYLGKKNRFTIPIQVDFETYKEPSKIEKISQNYATKESEPITKNKKKIKTIKKNDLVKKEKEENISKKEIKEIAPKNLSPKKISQSINTKDTKKKTLTSSKKIDKRSIYKSSKKTNRSNVVLEMEGWDWETIPKPNDTTEETGKITFKIKINSYGEVIDIESIERSVSINLESIYREAIENSTFIKISEEKDADQQFFYGKVTFYIKYK